MLKIAWYELKKLFRNYRWIIIFIVQPIILISLLSLVAYRDPTGIKVIIFNKDQNEYSQKVVDDLQNEKDFDASVYSSEQELMSDINKDRAKMAVVVDVGLRDGLIKGKVTAIGNATVPEISFISKLKFAKAIEITSANLAKENVQLKIDQSAREQRDILKLDQENSISNIKAEISKVGLPAEFQEKINSLIDSQKADTNFKIDQSTDVPKIELVDTDNSLHEIKYFDLYASALLIMITLLITLKASDTTITEERTTGTFERFFVTPYRKYHMIFGKLLAISLLNVFVIALMMLTMVSLTHVAIGPLWLVFLLCYLTALSAAALGIFISTITYAVNESVQASNLVFFSSIIVSGLIFQPESMQGYVKYITYAMPFTYSIKAMREINLLGMGFFDVWRELAIVIAFTIAFILIALLALRRKAT
jgi:ABC-type multidrug transport system permease subunit